jgi:carboxymethylenebutenolidase
MFDARSRLTGGVAALVVAWTTWATGMAPAAAVGPVQGPGPKETVVEGVRQSLTRFRSAGRNIRIERYYPAKEGKYPTVLLLYGGGGAGPAPGGLHALGRDFARRGYVALLPHYFDQTGIRMADPPTIDRNFVSWMGTINAAIDYARTLPDVDPDRIGLVGWSLGSSLSLEVAATNDHVAAVVGVVGGMALEILDKMKRMPPTLLLDGEADHNYPVHLARGLARVLRERGVEVESKIYPGEGHGFRPEAALDAAKRTNAWFDKYLRDRPRGAQDQAAPGRRR